MNRQILDEASAWFVDFRVGDIDAGSRARFDDWLRQSPEHIRAYIEIAKTYVELPALKSVSDINTDALIAAARRDTNVVSFEIASPGTPSVTDGPVTGAAPSRRTTSESSRAAWLRPRALAASLVLVGLGGVLAGWLWLHRYPTYATEIGEHRSITLADGSTVDLNARSEIRVEFSKGERAVELVQGQALFEVAKDANRAFIVKSGSAWVRAVGTQFDVNRGQSGTTVTVIEGRVAVSNEGSPGSPPVASGSAVDVAPRTEGAVSAATYVSAGEEVTVTRVQVSKPRHTDVAAATAWMQHRLVFDGTRLSDVVEQFNRYNTRRLVVEAPELADFHVSGVYASTDPASLIRFLKEQPGIVVVESDEAVRIMRP
jgi:transmembrane sensor